MSGALTLATALAQNALDAGGGNAPGSGTAWLQAAAAAESGSASGLHTILFELTFDGFAWSVTPWKLIGYGGVALFGLRWIVQAIASRRARAPTMPLAFWLMSVAGSCMLLAYFVWGKNDSVGILSNLMPSLIYSYNLFLYFQHRRRAPAG